MFGKVKACMRDRIFGYWKNVEQDRIGKATFAYQLCWRTVCTSDYSLADASSYSVLTMYLGGYRKSISKQLIDGILAAEPQHRVLARRHHHAGIGTMHNCVVQIGIGETTHRRSDISARSSCWTPAHAPLTISWPMRSGTQFQIWRYFLQYGLQLRPIGKHEPSYPCNGDRWSAEAEWVLSASSKPTRAYQHHLVLSIQCKGQSADGIKHASQ